MTTNERRTELKSNLLADRLEGFALAVKPHLKLFGVLAAAVVVLVCVYAAMVWQREKASASAWSDYYFSGSRTEVLRDVYEEHPKQSAGLWARQASGDALLGQALGQIYLDRDLADKLLREASDQYQYVITHSKDSLLVSRATYGLAQVLESQGKSEEALKEYKKLVIMADVHPEMRADIARRVEFLQSGEGEKFITWFKNNRPVAPKAVDLPADLKSLPDKPDINFATPGESKPSVPSETDAKPASDVPQVPEGKPTDPAADTKPADQTPAEAANENPLRIETPSAEPNKGSGS
jgi:tetratricopeptide (TPR) repeat protein